MEKYRGEGGNLEGITAISKMPIMQNKKPEGKPSGFLYVKTNVALRLRS